MPIDAHLDLSYNAIIRGTHVLAPACEQVADAEGIPTVGLPDLRRGGAKLVCATIYTWPDSEGSTRRGYRTAQEAFEQAQAHLAWYRKQFDAGEMRLITRREELVALGDGNENARAVPAILLMEGGDPIRSSDDIEYFFNQGVRMLGMAWKRTRLAGGTGAPGPLTDEGRLAVKVMDRIEMIHDASHLAEESFWELMRLSEGPVAASHSNCRAIVPTDRQLSDEMIRAIVQRGGVIGINFFDRFLMPPDQVGTRRANLGDVVRHVRHICDLAGDALHVGLGTDMDGGLGREQIPQEIQTSADLPKVEAALVEGGFTQDEARGVMEGNWKRFFEESLAR